MLGLLSSFISSFFVTLLILRSARIHNHISGDFNLSGPQKFHDGSVPRIGGISIILGIIVATFFRLTGNQYTAIEIAIVACSLPAFGIGLAEDLTKKIGIKTRLFFTAFAALIASHFLGIQITTLSLPGIDYLLSFTFISIIFTVFAITGLANAYNIIDGFNGLSSMVAIITLAAITYLGYLMKDPLLIYLGFIMIGAISGFFIWNYPRGLVFLGDGGAYLIGFWIAVLSMLLTVRHPSISPWFALVINAYPIIETLFSIYRRKIHRGKSPGQPDGIHFHTLIFRRILKPAGNKKTLDWYTANARTAPYLWLLTTMAIMPAVLWWNSTAMLICSFILFSITYVWLYRSIVIFKTPKWLKTY
jgi:UDP-GlcNAc:undecaprenyl-phosphate GlcNAc-1-phosphate transferase